MNPILAFRSYFIGAYHHFIDNYLALFYLKKKGVIFDSDTIRLHGIPYVMMGKNSRIILGRNIQINSRERSNPLALDHATTFIVYDGASITIDDNCSLSGTIIISKTNIKIGTNTLIGANTRIYDTDFHSADPIERQSHPDQGVKSRPIEIGANVFIGCHVHILKGVVIANNAVVPAGSFIRKDFPNTEKD